MRIRERFNPRAPCGARPDRRRGTGGDKNFNLRAPCGARPCAYFNRPQPSKFQPTRPLRGATAPLSLTPFFSLIFQPTRPLRGATKHLSTPQSTKKFQPTRPLRGATFLHFVFSFQNLVFQPTRPLRGATEVISNTGITLRISTHAPLAGRDSKSVQITMHIFAITDKFQMLLHRMPPVRAFCSFLMQENHADFGCEPPK